METRPMRWQCAIRPQRLIDYKLNGEFHFELYEFNYSFQNEEMTSFNSAREIMTEELYKNKREESQLGNEE